MLLTITEQNFVPYSVQLFKGVLRQLIGSIFGPSFSAPPNQPSFFFSHFTSVYNALETYTEKKR